MKQTEDYTLEQVDLAVSRMVGAGILVQRGYRPGRGGKLEPAYTVNPDLADDEIEKRIAELEGDNGRTDR
jgi:hypothetical protein